MSIDKLLLSSGSLGTLNRGLQITLNRGNADNAERRTLDRGPSDNAEQGLDTADTAEQGL